MEQNQLATKKQLWALFCATKEDFRNRNLTKEEASKLLSELNKNRPIKESKDNLLNYLKKNCEPLKEKFKDVVGAKSIIIDEMNPKRKYSFFGGGCGFAWLEYDGRKHKITKVIQEYQKIRDEFDKWFINTHFTKKQIEDFRKMGSPLQAIMFQDCDIKMTIQFMLKKYMEYIGINVENVYVRTRLD